MPTVASVTTTEFNSDSTTHNCNLPATVDAGDGLLIIFAGANSDFAAYNLTAPTGFTEVADLGWDLSGTRHRIGVYIKVADGSEDGGTANVGTQDAVAGTGHVYRITDWGGATSSVEVSSKAQGDDDNNADPPAHTPSGGSAEYLWIAAAAIAGAVEASAAPTDYTNLTTSSGAGDEEVGLSTARRVLEASSENPGTFTSSVEHWLAVTISVEPSAGAETQTLTGTLFQSASTFNTGTVSAGAVDLAGTLFQQAPTFPTGTVTTTVGLTGTLFQSTPTFFTGTAALDDSQAVTGALFQSSPTFFQGEVVRLLQQLAGSLHQSTPTFFQGSMDLGAVEVVGVLFESTPNFPAGTVTPGSVGLAGSLFQAGPTFYAGRTFRVVDHPANPSTAPLTFATGRVTDPPEPAATTLAASKATATASDTSGTATPTNEPGKAE